jgi:hypothetical protein
MLSKSRTRPDLNQQRGGEGYVVGRSRARKVLRCRSFHGTLEQMETSRLIDVERILATSGSVLEINLSMG